MSKKIKKLDPKSLGQWAVVTGGSSGIGFAHAQILAAHGFDLMLAARDSSKLAAAAQKLSSEFGVEAKTIAGDLGTEVGQQAVLTEMDSLDLGVFVGSAGAPAPGWFAATELDKYQQSVGLKINANLALSQAAARKMRVQERGAILLVSSTGGLQGIPYLSVTAAAEAFVLSFGEALHYELKPLGVKASVLLPGPTRTPAFEKMAANSDMRVSPMFASDAAHEGLSALMRGAPTWIAGRPNRIMAAMLSRKAGTKLMGKMMTKLFAVKPLQRGGSRDVQSV
jgi:short-subunit dehydrogenase